MSKFADRIAGGSDFWIGLQRLPTRTTDGTLTFYSQFGSGRNVSLCAKSRCRVTHILWESEIVAYIYVSLMKLMGYFLWSGDFPSHF